MSARTPLSTTLTTLLITASGASGTLLTPDQFITELQRNDSTVITQNISDTKPLIKTISYQKLSSTILSSSKTYLDEKFNRVEQELLSYLQLKPDWDYDDGIVPQSYNIDTSIRFLTLLKNFHLPLPKPMLAGDGEVCLYWKKENFYIEVGFEEEGEFSYAVDNHKTPFGEDDCSINDFIKTRLYASLNNFTILA